MWHSGLGAVSSVAERIWHSGIDARGHGTIYHSQHQWCCWIYNGHVAWTILYRFCSSERSCCIYQSYYIWSCYTSCAHKYKRYVIQSDTIPEETMHQEDHNLNFQCCVILRDVELFLWCSLNLPKNYFGKFFYYCFSGVKFGSKMISANFWTCICSDSWIWESTLQSSYFVM